jgi:TPP-dependent pyruvate/acetoin dehydrogenase alpha subunit
VKAYLRRRGILADDASLVAEARQAVQRAIAEAEAHPPKPPLETLFRHVYADPLWQQREQLEELRRALDDDPRVGELRDRR